MIRRPPRSTQSRSSAASDVYKRQVLPQRLDVTHLETDLLQRVEGGAERDDFPVGEDVAVDKAGLVFRGRRQWSHRCDGVVEKASARSQQVHQGLAVRP